MYIGYEQVAVDNTVKDVNDLTVPAIAQFAEIQASGFDVISISYTMDGSTTPTTVVGMFMLTTHEPKLVEIADLRSIKFTRAGGNNSSLNIHYIGSGVS